MSNERDTVLYVGVTNNLERRIYEHKSKIIKGFTKKYNIDRLVYFEHFNDINEAIKREKQLKGGSRKKKEDLINKFNPEWKDLGSI
jgi:putative endonuclease